MGLISRKQIKKFRQFILWPNLEFSLLFVYIVCFAFIIKIKTTTMNGSGLRENDAFAVTSQQYHADLKTYYQSASFE